MHESRTSYCPHEHSRKIGVPDGRAILSREKEHGVVLEHRHKVCSSSAQLTAQNCAPLSWTAWIVMSTFSSHWRVSTGAGLCAGSVTADPTEDAHGLRGLVRREQRHRLRVQH